MKRTGETQDMLKEFERIKSGGGDPKAPRLEEGEKAEQAKFKGKAK